MEMFKEKFIERYKEIILDWEEFIEFSKLPIRRSIRVNTLKSSKKEVVEKLEKHIGDKR